MIVGGIGEHTLNTTVFTPSTWYWQDDYTWCVPQAKAIASWRNTFYVIKNDVVIIIGVFSAISAIILIFFLTEKEKKPLDFWECAIVYVRTLICLSSTFRATTLIRRMIHILCLGSCMVLSAMFSAFMVICLTHEIYEKQVSSLAELMELEFQMKIPKELVDKNVMNFKYCAFLSY